MAKDEAASNGLALSGAANKSNQSSSETDVSISRVQPGPLESSEVAGIFPFQEDFQAKEIVVNANGLRARRDLSMNSPKGTGGAILLREIVGADLDATPSVAFADVFITTGTTTITDFLDGKIGQVLYILATGNITIDSNTNIALKGGNDFAMQSGFTLTLMRFSDTQWREVARSQTDTVSLYSGAVTSGGSTGTPFPGSWSATKNSTGTYTVTHNLGTTNYSVVANSTDQFYICQINSRASNSFQVITYNPVATAVGDCAFNFILSL